MAGLVPAIHVFFAEQRTWKPGTSLRRGFDRLSTSPASESRSSARRSMHRKAKKRKFFIVTSKVAHQASGFRLLNGDNLFASGPLTFLPPLGLRGFRNYPERPVFLANAKLGRIHWDLEEYSGYWFISEKMKSVLQMVDPGAFSFLACEMRSPDGMRQPTRWLCDMTRVLDALDEAQSTARIGVASNGSKFYNLSGSERLSFQESIVGDFHIFRMKFFEAKVICDEELRLACKSADLKGISFDDPSR
jgi:Protein of unknown function (DUF1629)